MQSDVNGTVSERHRRRAMAKPLRAKFAKYSFMQLKEFLRDRHIATGGKKAVLIERLVAVSLGQPVAGIYHGRHEQLSCKNVSVRRNQKKQVKQIQEQKHNQFPNMTTESDCFLTRDVDILSVKIPCANDKSARDTDSLITLSAQENCGDGIDKQIGQGAQSINRVCENDRPITHLRPKRDSAELNRKIVLVFGEVELFIEKTPRDECTRQLIKNVGKCADLYGLQAVHLLVVIRLVLTGTATICLKIDRLLYTFVELFDYVLCDTDILRTASVQENCGDGIDKQIGQGTQCIKMVCESDRPMMHLRPKRDSAELNRKVVLVFLEVEQFMAKTPRDECTRRLFQDVGKCADLYGLQAVHLLVVIRLVLTGTATICLKIDRLLYTFVELFDYVLCDSDESSRSETKDPEVHNSSNDWWDYIFNDIYINNTQNNAIISYEKSHPEPRSSNKISHFIHISPNHLDYIFNDNINTQHHAIMSYEESHPKPTTATNLSQQYTITADIHFQYLPELWRLPKLSKPRRCRCRLKSGKRRSSSCPSRMMRVQFRTTQKHAK